MVSVYALSSSALTASRSTNHHHHYSQRFTLSVGGAAKALPPKAARKRLKPRCSVSPVPCGQTDGSTVQAITSVSGAASIPSGSTPPPHSPRTPLRLSNHNRSDDLRLLEERPASLH
ncbi:hypothetical protein AOLI_G00221530 [Acnodon oligacanthus]